MILHLLLNMSLDHSDNHSKFAHISMLPELMVFDVLGTRFRCAVNTFDKHKSCLLYSLVIHKDDDDYQFPSGVFRTGHNEFFIQRSPDIFRVMLEYFINGTLHTPKHLCHEEISDEFNFWNLKYENVCDSCSKEYTQTTDPISEELTKYERRRNQNYFQRIRQNTWTFVEDPHSSTAAFAFFVVSMSFIFVSTINIVVSSVPEIQYCPFNDTHKGDNSTSDDVDDRNKKAALDSLDDFEYTECVGTLVFNVIDMICVSWFTMEFILRMVTCPNYKKFFTCFLTYVDILSIAPFFFELIIWLIDPTFKGFHEARPVLTLLRILKLLRVFRILKLARYWSSLKVLGKTLKSAKEELVMLMIFVLLALLICSNFLYQLEKEVDDTLYTSIPATFWWCIVTLTTVGYGDMYPKTTAGKVVAGITCVFGVLLMAFPVAVIVEKFTKAYSEEKRETAIQMRLRKRRKTSISLSRRSTMKSVRQIEVAALT